MSDSPPELQDDLLDGLLADFLDESDQLLSQLNESLLELDEWVRSLGDDHGQRCDDALLNEMFRAAHSIKGLSAMLGLTEINQLTHKIENVFDAARRNELAITSEVTELMFLGLDQLTALVGLLKEPGREPVDCEAAVEAIRRLLQSAGVERKQASQAEAEAALGLEAVREEAGPPPAATGDETPPDDDPFAGVEDEDEIPDKYLSIFVDEAEQALDALAAALLAVEAAGGQEEIKGLLATAHKLKGSAASIGLNRVARLAHLMEDLLESLLDSRGSLSPAVADVLLNCIDGLQHHLADLRRGSGGFADFAHLGRELLKAHSDHQAAGKVRGSGFGVQDSQPSTLNSQLSTGGRTTYVGEVTLQPDLPNAGLKAQLIYEKLAKVGEVISCDPTPAELDEIDRLALFRFQVATDKPPEAISDQLRVAGVLEASVRVQGSGCSGRGTADGGPGTAEIASLDHRPPTSDFRVNPHPPPPAPSPQPPAPSPSPEVKNRASECSKRPTETVRVDIDRLDQLMDLAGQLVINRAQFSQIGEKLAAVLACQQSLHAFSQARDVVRALFEAIHQLERVSQGIQQSVMDTRMVPIGPLFTRFKRVVRDITRANGKDVRLEIKGEKTELDKRMIDELGDPLVHMVRNAADHGIELPDGRAAAGKPRQGTVTLNAFHRGNSIVIEVSDDGKGLDTGRILRKCLDKGLLAEADAERMTPHQIHQMVWHPGLSTAEKVTDISGRGMGMDIVKSKIEELSGTVEITSAPGKGTTVTVQLPLTLAILPSLMVEIAGDAFAMPMESVAEIVGVGREQLSTVGGRRVATVRGSVVPLLRLADMLRFHGSAAAGSPAQTSTLVIIGQQGRQVGLVVDRVLGEEDIVIKSIAENYKNVPGIAGASVLGDGRVALILDVPALIDMASRPAAATC